MLSNPEQSEINNEELGLFTFFNFTSNSSSVESWKLLQQLQFQPFWKLMDICASKQNQYLKIYLFIISSTIYDIKSGKNIQPIV